MSGTIEACCEPFERDLAVAVLGTLRCGDDPDGRSQHLDEALPDGLRHFER
jgi:hypothetical protein